MAGSIISIGDTQNSFVPPRLALLFGLAEVHMQLIHCSLLLFKLKIKRGLFFRIRIRIYCKKPLR